MSAFNNLAPLILASGALFAQSAPAQWLPTGASITPMAVSGTTIQTLNPGLKDFPNYIADHAVAAVQTPDSKTLLVLTSGYNRNFGPDGKGIAADSNDYVFIFDVQNGAPRQTQVLPIPNTFLGLAVAPDGRHFFVSGGSDDNVHIFELVDGTWREAGEPIALGHASGEGVERTRASISPAAAGLGVSADGNILVVADFENDALSVVDWAAHRLIGELDLRPGKIDPKRAGERGGTYPYAVAVRGSDTAYVSSVRDREVLAVSLRPAPHLRSRIALTGNPNQLAMNRAGTRLYVAEDNTDRIAVIDTSTDRLKTEFRLRLPESGTSIPSRGIAPNALALSSDERRLFVSAGGINAVALIALPGGGVRGWLPTGWYPTAVSVNDERGMLYVLNGKSPHEPNKGNCVRLRAPPPNATGCPADRPFHAANDYVLQHSKAALATIPMPGAAALRELTHRVALNNRLASGLSAAERKLFGKLRKRIRHVIYIVKENRTYDQILGDLPVGNGDPTLAQFPRPVTPNQHRLASDFVDLDDFYDSGEVSGSGWPWSVAGRTTEILEKTVPMYYGARGFSYDSEGTNRDVNVGLATSAERRAANPRMQPDPDVLPGAADVVVPDGPDDEEQERGNLWDEALRRHMSVRNYGFFIDLARYSPKYPENLRIPLEHDPAAAGLIVAYSSSPSLAPHTDPYFRGFDNRFADFYRYREWAREFGAFERSDSLPRLELVRLMHDHLGDFAGAADGVNTPDRQVADNDYAVGLLVERLAHSRFAADTLVFVLEDDAQDGPDHVSAHRSIALIAGPYVKRNAVISARHNTVDLLRTIEMLLGLRPLNLHDALAAPLTEVFDLAEENWTFDAAVPEPLRATELPLPPGAGTPAAAHCGRPERDSTYWQAQTKDMDFSAEDLIDSVKFNHILWEGQNGPTPYPETRSGADLRAERGAMLTSIGQTCRSN
jgi:DNA-binding beta-propeller fold protein YncE